MMIDTHYGIHTLVCDICGEASEEEFASWDETRGAIEDLEWETVQDKTDGSWVDICPECVGGE